MSTADRLLHDLRALLAEFRSPEHNYWLTSACADRLEAVLTEHAPDLTPGSCANQLAGWLMKQEAEKNCARVDGFPGTPHGGNTPGDLRRK